MTAADLLEADAADLRQRASLAELRGDYGNWTLYVTAQRLALKLAADARRHAAWERN